MALRIVRRRFVDEFQRFAGARVVDLDARPLAAAARGVDELGRAGPRLRKELDPERLAAGLYSLTVFFAMLALTLEPWGLGLLTPRRGSGRKSA